MCAELGNPYLKQDLPRELLPLLEARRVIVDETLLRFAGEFPRADDAQSMRERSDR